MDGLTAKIAASMCASATWATCAPRAAATDAGSALSWPYTAMDRGDAVEFTCSAYDGR